MVSAEAPLSAAAVNDGGQIREVPVQVDVLSVVSADGRGIISVILRIEAQLKT